MPDFVVLSAVEQLAAATKLEPMGLRHFPTSAELIMGYDGYALVRAMGSGGGGGLSGANGGSVALKGIRFKAGDKFTVAIGAGGLTNANGGTTTVELTGSTPWTGTVPGGKSGVAVQDATPAANDAPTGFDEFWLGGLGGKSAAVGRGGGGAAALQGRQGGKGADAGALAGGGGGIGGDGANGSGGGTGGPATATAIGPNLLGENTTNDAAGDFNKSNLLLLPISGGGGALNSNGGSGGGGGGINSQPGNGRSGGFGGGGGGGNGTGIGGLGGRGGGAGGGGTPVANTLGAGWVCIELFREVA